MLLSRRSNLLHRREGTWVLRVFGVFTPWLNVIMLIAYPIAAQFGGRGYYRIHGIPRDRVYAFVTTLAALDAAFLIGYFA